MDILSLIKNILMFIMRIINEYVLPNLSAIVKTIVIIAVISVILRFVLPLIWHNILVIIIKISDRKNHSKGKD